MSLSVEVIPSEKLPEDKRFKKLENNKWLPTPMSGTLMLYGAAGSGKSSWLYTFYNSWTANYFDEVVFFVATKDSAKVFEGVKQRNVLVIHEYSDELLDAYLKDLEMEQLERREAGKYPLRVSICFDDMAGNRAFKSTSSAVSRLVMNTRHYHCLTVITSQRFRLMSNTIRNNMHYTVLYRVAKSDIQKIGEEFATPLDEKDFERLVLEIFKNKYDYLVMDMRAPIEERFRHGMSEPIEIKHLIE